MENEYRHNIRMMASSLDLIGEMPHRYCDEFLECASNLLKNERESLDVKGVLSYESLFSHDKKEGKIIGLISNFIREGDETIKKIIAMKICNIMADNAVLYYRDEIESDVKKEYDRSFAIEDESISSVDYVSHSG